MLLHARRKKINDYYDEEDYVPSEEEADEEEQEDDEEEEDHKHVTNAEHKGKLCPSPIPLDYVKVEAPSLARIKTTCMSIGGRV
jgi:hypothetical protein